METWGICYTLSVMLADYIILRIISEHNPKVSKIHLLGNLNSKSRSFSGISQTWH